MRPGWNHRNGNNHYQNSGFDFSNFMSELPGTLNAIGRATQAAGSWLENTINQPGPSRQHDQQNRGEFQGAQSSANIGPHRNSGSYPNNPNQNRPHTNHPGKNSKMDEEPIPNSRPQAANGHIPNASRTNLQPNTGRANPNPQGEAAQVDDLADRMGERIKANNAKEPIHNNFFGGGSRQAKEHNGAQADNSGSGGLLDGRMGERIKPNSGTTFGSTSSR